MVDENRFRAMASDGSSLVIYDRNRFKRDTALDVWQRRWSVLMRWCVDMLIYTRFADMPFIRFSQELPNCRHLRDALNLEMVVEDGDPTLDFRFCGKPYMVLYLMHGD